MGNVIGNASLRVLPLVVRWSACEPEFHALVCADIWGGDVVTMLHRQHW